MGLMNLEQYLQETLTTIAIYGSNGCGKTFLATTAIEAYKKGLYIISDPGGLLTANKSLQLMGLKMTEFYPVYNIEGVHQQKKVAVGGKMVQDNRRSLQTQLDEISLIVQESKPECIVIDSVTMIESLMMLEDDCFVSGRGDNVQQNYQQLYDKLEKWFWTLRHDGLKLLVCTFLERTLERKERDGSTSILGHKPYIVGGDTKTQLRLSSFGVIGQMQKSQKVETVAGKPTIKNIYTYSVTDPNMRVRGNSFDPIKDPTIKKILEQIK